MTDTNTFEIAGISFRQSPLKLKQALKAEAILAETVLPGFVAAGTMRSGLDTQALRMAIGGLERVSELVDIFAGRCEVQRPGTEAFVALPSFLDMVFERKNAAVLAWLAACIEWQFADFFDDDGQLLLLEVVSRFDFLKDSTGESGE